MSGERFVVERCGVDDLTLGFDMTGSGSIGRLESMPGYESRRGKMLGDRSSWGSFAHLLGRSVSFWRRETSRLYVQAKLADDGDLCPLPDLRGAVDQLLTRMALVGLTTYEPAWVTRIDVAVDAVCRPEDGKLLLDALEACRLPNGWRVRSVGTPRSTVYFIARVKDDAKARAYCRNLKTREGEPFGRIRLEAQARFDPFDAMVDTTVTPSFCASVWCSRYAQLDGSVKRLPRETQATDIAAMVGRGELTYAQGERISMFLDLERLGLARSYYPTSVFAGRTREARRLGLCANDPRAQGLCADVGLLLAAYREAVDAVAGPSAGEAVVEATAAGASVAATALSRATDVEPDPFPGL